MSSAVNMFLRQAIMRGGLPFSVEIPQFKPEVIEAMKEAKKISRDPNTKRYGSFAEALDFGDWKHLETKFPKTKKAGSL